MVDKFIPELNKVYFINQYTMLHILKGNGAIQVDFKNYDDWDDRLIFLEKGQYIKFLSDDFLVRKIEFENEDLFKNESVRVLFKHMISLGYINFSECSDCQRYIRDTIIDQPKNILDISSDQWYWQNPFNASADEYQIIFDTKDIIDQQYKNHLSNEDIASLIGAGSKHVHSLVRDKVGLSIKGLLANKRLTQIQKDIAFTDKPIQEIAYDFGYKDPAYFNRLFKQNTGKTPFEFRKDMAFEVEDTFLNELFLLIREFHVSQRNVDFYAEKMYISNKTLSKKVRDKLQISIGQLIRQQIIKTSKKLLGEGQSIHETAYQLGFEEANHFSSFFKNHTQQTPSDFLVKKYN